MVSVYHDKLLFILFPEECFSFLLSKDWACSGSENLLVFCFLFVCFEELWVLLCFQLCIKDREPRTWGWRLSSHRWQWDSCKGSWARPYWGKKHESREGSILATGVNPFGTHNAVLTGKLLIETTLHLPLWNCFLWSGQQTEKARAGEWYRGLLSRTHGI